MKTRENLTTSKVHPIIILLGDFALGDSIVGLSNASLSKTCSFFKLSNASLSLEISDSNFKIVLF